MDELADLLRQTGHDHHQAYLETNGEDPEWALWYAEYLVDKLPAHVGRTLTRSEIVYLLWAASQAHETNASEAWPEFYASFMLEA